jgi:hypothetical protein
MIKFQETGHIYTSIVPDGTQWLGVTTLVNALKEKFDAQYQAPKSSRNTKSKWFKVPVQEILIAWENEGIRASELGHWYHGMREQNILSKGHVDGLPVIRSVMSGDIKLAPEQVLTDGIYPEHLVYLQSAGICGQSDVVTVHDGQVDISDYKTSKEIATESYVNWEGARKMMLPPLAHIQDCHINHYALQLSIYLYIILRHNPSLKPGKLRIDHIKFVEAAKDKYGYPLYHLDDEGNPIIEQIIPVEVPYMKTEVHTLVAWLKDNKNRNKIFKHN